jgi:hypothetical protein
VEVLVTGHPNLNDIESIEVVDQAKIIAHGVFLERILDN